jgi:uncharacterized repeat protein (TIGR02543 family)
MDCTAVGYDSNNGGSPIYATETNGVWATPVALSANGTDITLWGVSCADAADCTAVGNVDYDEPIYVTETSGTWGTPVEITGAPSGGGRLSGVSCAYATDCTAVGLDFNNQPMFVTSTGTDSVSFVSDGGAAVSPLSGPDGSSITLPSDIYPGYSFGGWFTAASGGTEIGVAGLSYTIPPGGATLYAHWTSLCAAGLHSHVLTAAYGNSTFTGLFCVNGTGIGTYTQGAVSGIGTITVVKGTTVVAALGKNLALAGSTNGTKSSFVELAPAPIKLGTFTIT